MTGNTGTTPIAAAINRFYFVLDTDSLYLTKIFSYQIGTIVILITR